MTGNSALLHHFKNVNGGYVAFGSKGGRISGKGTVSNGALSLNQQKVFLDNTVQPGLHNRMASPNEEIGR